MNKEYISILQPDLREEDIQEIIKYDLTDIALDTQKPIYVITCCSMHSRTSSLKTSREMCVIHNTYITSFFYNVGLFTLTAEHHSNTSDLAELDYETLVKSRAKAFIAEQCYTIRNSHLARTLLIETVIEMESNFRRLYSYMEACSDLKNSATALAQISADFSLHHEIGHHLSSESHFEKIISPVIEEYVEDITDDIDTASLKYEAYADIFSINCCLGRYSSILSEDRIREYILFVVSLFTITNSLYIIAEDLDWQNNGGDEPKGIEERMAALSHREAIMTGYILAFNFSPETVQCLDKDDYLPLQNNLSLSNLFEDTSFVTDSFSIDSRRVSELLSKAFDAKNGFEYFINNSKKFRLIS